MAGWCAVAYALELFDGDVKLPLGGSLYLDIHERWDVVFDTVHLYSTIDDCPCAREVHIDGSVGEVAAAEFLHEVADDAFVDLLQWDVVADKILNVSAVAFKKDGVVMPAL